MLELEPELDCELKLDFELELLLGTGDQDESDDRERDERLPICLLLELLPGTGAEPKVLSNAANLTWKPPPPLTICSDIDELAIVSAGAIGNGFVVQADSHPGATPRDSLMW